jgi:hypothetical protein
VFSNEWDRLNNNKLGQIIKISVRPALPTANEVLAMNCRQNLQDLRIDENDSRNGHGAALGNNIEGAEWEYDWAERG